MEYQYFQSYHSVNGIVLLQLFNKQIIFFFLNHRIANYSESRSIDDRRKRLWWTLLIRRPLGVRSTMKRTDSDRSIDPQINSRAALKPMRRPSAVLRSVYAAQRVRLLFAGDYSRWECLKIECYHDSRTRSTAARVTNYESQISRHMILSDVHAHHTHLPLLRTLHEEDTTPQVQSTNSAVSYSVDFSNVQSNVLYPNCK